MPRTTSFPSAAEQDVHSESQYARAKLGEKIVTADGRVYRYAKAGGTALAAGKLTVAAEVVPNHVNMAVAAAATVGATQVTVTLGATAATANQYAEGFLIINDADGEGIAYKVASHPAASSGASLVVTLEDPIKVALTTSSEASLFKNKYDGLVISATDQADAPVGVSNIAVTANYYFWVQTGGIAAVLADETIAVGSAVVCGSSTAGAVETADTDDVIQQVGVAIQAGVDTEYRAVELTLD